MWQTRVCVCTVCSVLWVNTCPCSLTGAWTILHINAPCAKAPASVSNHGHKVISQNKADSVTSPLNNFSSLFYPLLVLIFTTEALHPHPLVEWIRFVCIWWVRGSVIHSFSWVDDENIMCYNGMDLCVLPCVYQVHTRQHEKNDVYLPEKCNIMISAEDVLTQEI